MSPLLEVQSLTREFTLPGPGRRRTTFAAVADVSFTLDHGETLAVVGESGSGKTTLGRCLVRAVEPTRGHILFDGALDVTSLRGAKLMELRRRVQLVFQDPFASLNPRMTIRDIVAEPLICNRTVARRQVSARVAELLEIVGLDPSLRDRYPHAFSGGQRQRIGIARALATSPDLIICDEAVSALDVSVQAQILNLLVELRERMGTSYLFISHDLSVVHFIAHRVGVMYMGRFVEVGTRQEVFTSPQHPYTEALLSARPVVDPQRRSERIVLGGEAADPADPPSGCPFHPRCRYATDLCRAVPPPLTVGEGHRQVACHHANRLHLQGITPIAVAEQGPRLVTPPGGASDGRTCA